MGMVVPWYVIELFYRYFSMYLITAANEIINVLWFVCFLFLCIYIHINLYIFTYCVKLCVPHGYETTVPVRENLSMTCLQCVAAGLGPDWRWASVHLYIAAAQDGVAERWLTRGRLIDFYGYWVWHEPWKGKLLAGRGLFWFMFCCRSLGVCDD